MKNVCICGGGSLGHVMAGWLSAHHCAVVSVLTNRPEKWEHEICIDTPDGSILKGSLSKIYIFRSIPVQYSGAAVSSQKGKIVPF